MEDYKRMRRILSPEEAREFIQLAKEYHDGKRRLPPEIERKRREIEAAIQNADRFIAFFRVVDYSMVDDIVRMKLELDGLYCDWASSEHKKYTIH